MYKMPEYSEIQRYLLHLHIYYYNNNFIIFEIMDISGSFVLGLEKYIRLWTRKVAPIYEGSLQSDMWILWVVSLLGSSVIHLSLKF